MFDSPDLHYSRAASGSSTDLASQSDIGNRIPREMKHVNSRRPGTTFSGAELKDEPAPAEVIQQGNTGEDGDIKFIPKTSPWNVNQV